MRILVLASHNRKKAAELKQLVADLPYEIRTVDDYPGCPEVEEDGATFEANSLKKAHAVSTYCGQWALADDSGLEVDALGGAPGIFSARYGGLDNDQERNEYLLKNIESVPDLQRTARFVCCVTIFGDNLLRYQSRSSCEGRLLHEPRGEHGFGYDPIFLPNGHTRSMAELGPDEKNAISHRGKALRLAREFLKMIHISHG